MVHVKTPRTLSADEYEDILDSAILVAQEFAPYCASSARKQWVVDQIMRALLGDEYPRWVKSYNSGRRGMDRWDSGTKPPEAP